jgi:S-adenosylmethionine decarboxylase
MLNVTQLLVDARGCTGDLNDADSLAAAIRQAAITAGATPVGEVVSRFVPHGVTVALILAESHVVLSTWPEHRLALLDVMLCRPEMDPTQIWDALAPTLSPADVRQRRVVRAPFDPPAS